MYKETNCFKHVQIQENTTVIRNNKESLRTFSTDIFCDVMFYSRWKCTKFDLFKYNKIIHAFIML